MRFQIIIAALSLISLAACTSDNYDAAITSTEIMVFAGAGLTDVITEIGQKYEENHSVEIIYNFAGSNTLARQLVAAPKADVYLSASEQWMDYVEDAGILVDDSRHTFLTTNLVVVAQRNSHWQLHDPRLLSSLEFEHLSLANPEAVPAGVYAKEWLQSITVDSETLWSAVRDRIVPSADVRAALSLVEADQDILGIVYGSDAATSDDVNILYEIPRDVGPDIRFVAGLIRSSTVQESARDYLEFLQSQEARTVYDKYGFIPLDEVRE